MPITRRIASTCSGKKPLRPIPVSMFRWTRRSRPTRRPRSRKILGRGERPDLLFDVEFRGAFVELFGQSHPQTQERDIEAERTHGRRFRIRANPEVVGPGRHGHGRERRQAVTIGIRLEHDAQLARCDQLAQMRYILEEHGPRDGDLDVMLLCARGRRRRPALGGATATDSSQVSEFDPIDSSTTGRSILGGRLSGDRARREWA